MILSKSSRAYFYRVVIVQSSLTYQQGYIVPLLVGFFIKEGAVWKLNVYLQIMR